MNLNLYFDPVGLTKPGDRFIALDSVVGKNIWINTENTPIGEVSDFQIALLGVPEDRNSYNKGAALAPDEIRTKLYQLFRVNEKLRIIDLGNVKPGKTSNDTLFGLSDVISMLRGNQVTAIVMGGSQDLTIGCFMGMARSKNPINLVSVDSCLDLGNSLSGSDCYLRSMLGEKTVFSFTNLAHQHYLTAPEHTEMLTAMGFDAHRLGNLRGKLHLTEPAFRDADLVSFDIGAVKQSEAPGRACGNPNGLHAEEACQLARYAGLSERSSIFGLFEVNPQFDINQQTASLSAQIIWHFLDGFAHRRGEDPLSHKKKFKKFIISPTTPGHELVFYRSELSDRWWIEVPYRNNTGKYLAACSYEDYQQAGNHEVPDVWWRLYQRLNESSGKNKPG